MGKTARIGPTLSLLLLGVVAHAHAENVILNPGFTNQLDNWMVVPSPSYTVSWDGGVGNAAPGSAAVNLTSSPGSYDAYVARQCVPATGSGIYSVGASFRFPSSVAAVPIGSVVTTYFSDTGCTTPIGGSASFQTGGSLSPPDTWLTVFYKDSLQAPPGTASVMVNLRFSTFSAGTSFGWFDDIRLEPKNSCLQPLVAVPDGRLTAGVIEATATLWFAASLRAPAGPDVGNSYSLEFGNTSGANTPPGTLTVFSGDDPCGGGSTLATVDNSAHDPDATDGAVRVSFTSSGVAQPFFRAKLVNGSANPIPFSFTWSDTTMYSPAWSTNGAFDTFYSFQNTTAATLQATLVLVDSAGTVLSDHALEIGPGQTLSVNTSSLGAPRNRTGTARLSHEGPPGAIVAEAAIARFSTSPAYVQPVKFQAVREATH